MNLGTRLLYSRLFAKVIPLTHGHVSYTAENVRTASRVLLEDKNGFSMRNSYFLSGYVSGLKLEQKLRLETVAHKPRCADSASVCRVVLLLQD